MEGGAIYKVGGIGLGRAGTGRVRAYDLHPLCQVEAVVDSDLANLDLASKRFGVPGYADYESMFSAHRIDIVVASLPVRANYEVVMASTRAGVRAIVTEKPLTARLAEADEMVAACVAAGIQFAAGLVSWNRRNHQAARDLIQAGEIGDVRRINIYEANMQGGCHGINLARHFAGDAEVEQVIGWTKGEAASDYEDAHAGREHDPGFQALGGYLRFANGIEAFSSYEPVGWRGFEVVGTRGMLVKRSTPDLKLRLFRAPETVEEVAFDAFEEVEVPDVEPPPQGGYDAEGWATLSDGMVRSAAAVVDSLESGSAIQLTTGDDLRKALEICIALRESARRDQGPVKLPLADRSLVMYPQNSRWNYKKEILGEEAYMQELAAQRSE